MSQVILTNWTIYFADDAPAASSNYKSIIWTGGGGPETNTNTVNELFSEISHYFSLPANNGFDDTTPMRAVTPTVYEIGAFDQGDVEAWFIDPPSIEHLTGGSLASILWDRVTGTNSGIIKVPYTLGTQFVASDIGRAIVNGTATGHLIWYDTTNSEAWIRPTDNTSTHDWAGPAGTISVTGGTGSVTQNGAGISGGERLWSNIITIGTIEDNTRLYVAQNNVVLSNFWGNGTIDRLFLVDDGFSSGVIDNGFLTVYARQYGTLYDHFITDVSLGGRTSVPLSTAADINNTTGFRNIPVSSASSAFSVGEIVTGGTSGARGVVTENTGSPTTEFDYYLIDDLTDFTSGETLTGSIVGSNGTAGSDPLSAGPATWTNVTITFGEEFSTFNTNTGVDGGTEVITTDATHSFTTGDEMAYWKAGGTDNIGLSEGTLYYVRNLTTTTLSVHTSRSDAVNDLNRVDLTAAAGETHELWRTYDVDEDSNKEGYSIVINGGGRTLSQVYERLKYVTRRGETITLDGIQGQQYIGIDYRVDYLALTGAITNGQTVTQLKADGETVTSEVVHHNEPDGYLMLRDTRNGPLETGAGANNLQFDGSNFVTMTSTATTEVVTPVKASPFGTFAGGNFFGARGVYLENINAADANNYFLTDDGGTIRQPPATVPINVQVDDEDGNAVSGVRVRVEQTNGTLITDGETNVSGLFSDTFTYTIDVNVNVIVRLRGYLPFQTTGTITSSGLSVSVRFITDTIVD